MEIKVRSEEEPVVKLLFDHFPNVSRERIREYMVASDLMEAAEWDAFAQKHTPVLFYERSCCYVWNHAYAEVIRRANGDFDRVCKVFAEAYPDRPVVLDYGAGLGSFSAALAERDLIRKAHFHEINHNVLPVLRNRVREQPWGGAVSSTLLEHEADVLVAYGVFEHMPLSYLNRLFSSLRTKRVFMVNYCDKFNGQYPMHYLQDQIKPAFDEARKRGMEFTEVNWEYAEGMIETNEPTGLLA